ncbi:MAG: PucR family transcriptional regulator ligand-binding domain-containing protein [Synergistaceae bacterium]|nr:PucR family transcriptional regulator ligand-binding domain-containing protein [Synergistaceae bacterium]
MKVCDLFTLNQEFRGIEVICGKSGLKNSVKNIVTVEVTDTFRWLKPGDFVVTKGYFSQKGGVTLASFVRMLIDKKVAGLGIKLGIFISELPHEIMSLADIGEFPILSIPTSITYAAIVPSILHRLSGRKQYGQYILNRFQDDLNKLTKAAYHISDILGLLSAYIGYPACLFRDKSFQWITPPESESSEAMKSWVRQNRDSLAPGVGPVECAAVRGFSVFVIRGASEVVAFLAVDSDDRALTSADLQLVAKTLPAVCVYLLSGAKKLSPDLKSVDDLYERVLFDKDELDLQRLRHDVEEARIDYGAERRVWIAEFSQTSRQERERLKDIVSSAVGLIASECYCDRRDDRLTFAMRFEPMERRADILRDFFIKLSSEIAERHSQSPIYFGVSSACFDFGDLRRGCQDADFSLRMGRRLRIEPKVYFFESFMLAKLLDEMWANPILQRMHSEVVERLVRYDRLKNTELLKTLSALAHLDFNAVAAARELYLHRNTISQRIDKISGILGLDLNDTENRLVIQMAVRLEENTP